MKKLLLALFLFLLLPLQADAAFPTTFATLSGGNQPAALLDTMFGVVGNMGQVMCTAAGTNTIALTPLANMPTQIAYVNYQMYGFVVSNASTDAVTVNVSSNGALPLYLGDGATQAGSGSLVAGAYYLIIYNLALNSGSGGFQIVSTSSDTPLVLPNGTTATTQAASDSSTKVATTAFVNPGSSISGNGYLKLAAGLIIQWGKTSGIATGSSNISFPLTFPNNVFSLTLTSNTFDNSGQASTVDSAVINSTSGFTVHNNGATTSVFSWIAIGN